MHLVDNFGDLDVHNEFDILDCLESPLLANLDPILKDYIRNHLTYEQRQDLKETLIEHQQWVTEYSPAATACLMCNTAIYPMGLGKYPCVALDFLPICCSLVLQEPVQNQSSCIAAYT
jgi:hypothetical protein